MSNPHDEHKDGHDAHGEEAHGAKGGHEAGAGHEAHGGGHGGHGGHKGGHKGGHAEHEHHGPPPWLMSFGDMMTLFLCFFIILVTMADRQEGGLMAAGLGPFVTALESHGLDGALSGEQRLAAVNAFRERFGMAPERDPARLEQTIDVSDLSKLEDFVAETLRPHAEILQPSVAVFPADSADLSDTSKRYLDRIAETVRPGFGQILILEGHALDAGKRFANDNLRLAFARATSVRKYFNEQHEFVPRRVEARVWSTELGAAGGVDNVDARLVEPVRDAPKDKEPSDG